MTCADLMPMEPKWHKENRCANESAKRYKQELYELPITISADKIYLPY